ncbi:MAG: aminoacyl-tRNA hydrolase [Ruminococcaceae bacterium]|nr:aminoacyl-tRNA hydrolase [Oscillospiraceae bacterium]
MHMIVGLGNPGKQYEFTRHNAGFLCLDYLAAKNNIKVNKIKFKSLLGEGNINGEKVILLKPTTFMNLSGEAVVQAAGFYKVDVSDIIVVYDDISLPVGSLRIREKGSAGGHNGMKSIIYLLGKDNFPRIRLGVGSNGERDLADHVLGKFSKEEMNGFSASVEDAVEAISYMLKGDTQKAMNLYNKKGIGEGTK